MKPLAVLRDLLFASILIGAMSGTAHAFEIWDEHPSGELHQYMVVYFQGTWSEANEAVSLIDGGWHLATITSAAEQSFIENSLFSPEGDKYSRLGKYWLGAWQDADAANAYEGWNWVTGEAWDYTNWDSNFDSDGLSEEQRWLSMHEAMVWMWDDAHEDMGNVARVTGYIAERSGASVGVPEPASIMLMGLGLVLLAAFRRRVWNQG
ncbi:hypothetical protein Tgr7_2353 [Thioalkalivibrio sulfidiphilus HL-EbGr7]|uniref:C-type lectin domain-containing protein n=1 Tax=Thioalkalivibrio sulfidiphilus (strain HL-EbGR7) TaxID=396588 RepID=B8GV86_THISH|nr:PEP-CTERM sorting domain-containing protein [Thioalkalivibrio sulfidiphilus]ACL73432.1 hypothetical protein Tgr7_2353 [Thioalkalivibrio sulfidiphilus HL-EbGr7]